MPLQIQQSIAATVIPADLYLKNLDQELRWKNGSQNSLVLIPEYDFGYNAVQAFSYQEYLHIAFLETLILPDEQDFSSYHFEP